MGVSNHQPHHCLLNRSFRRSSKKTSKLRVIGLCARNSPVTGEFPKWPVTQKLFPFGVVIRVAMVAAATIVLIMIMAAADGERISIFPLVIKPALSDFLHQIYSLSKELRSIVITVDVAFDPSFLVIRCRKYSPSSRWLHQIATMVATDVPEGMTRVARQFWRTCPADNSTNIVWIFLKLGWHTL